MIANPYMVRYLAIIAALRAHRNKESFTIADILELADKHDLEVAHRSNVWDKLETMVEAGILERLTTEGYGRGVGVRYQLGPIALKLVDKPDLEVPA